MSAPVTFSHASVIDLVLQRNEWAELAHSNPEQLLNILLAALDTSNSPSLTDPSVEEAFKFHLEYLTPAPSSSVPNSTNGAPTHTIPSLYSILKTFWLPSSPSYFALATSATSTYTPSPYRFLYWDPQPLVLNGIACPACTAPLANCGCIRSGPFTIHDLAGPFFVIGCTYVCTANSAHVYASTDAAVRRTLPAVLNHDFSVHLVGGDNGVGPDVWNWQARGVSRALWNLVLGALHAGLARDMILQLVRGVQHGVPEAVGVSDENGAAEKDVNTNTDTALIEEDESEEESAKGFERNDVLLPASPALDSTNGSTGDPAAASANQIFNDTWTANSIIASLDIRNPPDYVLYSNNPITVSHGAVSNVVSYNPAQYTQLPTLNKEPHPFEAEIDVGGSRTDVSDAATGACQTAGEKYGQPTILLQVRVTDLQGQGRVQLLHE